MREFVLGQVEEDIRLGDGDGNIYVVPNDISSITTYVLFEQQYWFEKELSFVKRYLAPGMVALDVGANLGMYTIPMAKAVGPTGYVFAFEPGSNARGRLEQSVACNALQNISVSSHGVGARKARATLEINDSSELNAVSFDSNVSAGSESIEITTLDAEFPVGRGVQIDFLKIDAEGMEADVIRGAYNLLGQGSPVVMAEIKHEYTHNLDLLGLFHELGYRTYRLLGDSSMLVPLEDATRIDRLELNCFAVKTNTANLLKQRGLLADSIGPCILHDEEQTTAISAYCALPFAVDLGISASDVLLCPFFEGLIAYAAYRFVDKLSPDRKLALLSTAADHLRAYCQRTECMAALTTLARVSSDMGNRVASNETLVEILKRGKCELVQPFFPASGRFELLPADDVPAWFVAGLEDALDRQGSFSSMFSTDIDRLIRLVTGRFGSSKHFRSLGLKVTQQIPSPSRRAECFRRLVELEPYSAEAFANIGAALRAGQRSDSAITILKHALDVDDRCIESHRHLANAYLDKGDIETAIELFQRALNIAPDNAKLHSNLGTALCALGRLEEAHSSYKRAVSLAPAFAEAHANMSAVLLSLGHTEEAVVYGYRAVELDPSNADAANNLGASLADQGNAIEAMEHYRRAIAIKPGFASAHLNLGTALKNSWRVQEALDSYEKVIELDPNAMDARTHRLFLLSYLQDQAYEQAFHEACQYGMLAASNASPYGDWTTSKDPEKCLRIGMISGDFRVHSVGLFIEGVMARLSAHHSPRLEIYAYMNCELSDATTAAIKSTCRQWREVWEFSDEVLAKQIYDDQIDILIDLSGHTAYNRLPMFAWKPAPVQVTWLGYWATTGIKEIDYLLADPLTLPPEEEKWFTEKIWRLPESRLCFTPRENDPPVSSLPAIDNGYITFGAFHNLNKINEAVIDIWAQVVKAVPGSRLILKAKQFTLEPVRNRVIERFLAHDIEPNRLLLEGASLRDEYLSTYSRVDIQLDTFPFPGGTVTAESLWMGVPVLTMSGKHFLERQGVGLLISAGLPDWVAENERDYVVRAVSHSSNLSALADLRSRLRGDVMASPLYDASRFADNFEIALRGMWRIWCEEHPMSVTNEPVDDDQSDRLINLFHAGKHIEVERQASDLASQYPQSPFAWGMWGAALQVQGKDGLPMLTKAAELQPDDAQAQNNLGVALLEKTRSEEALTCFELAVRIDPVFAEGFYNLGSALQQLDRREEAVAAYDKAIALSPGLAKAHNNLACIFQDSGRFEEAVASYRRAIQADSRNTTAYLKLGLAQLENWQLEDAVRTCQDAFRMDSGDARLFSAVIAMEHNLPVTKTAQQFIKAKRFGELVAGRATAFSHHRDATQSERSLRVGFVSGDLRGHPVGYFMEGLMGALTACAEDRLSFWAYFPSEYPDATTERIKPHFAVWRSVAGVTEEALARQIKEDGIDILIDLAGHTAGNRLPVFAWKPAPVQISWLGYLNTTGLEAMDYLIADEWVLPETQEKYFTEAIWRLESSYLCFAPPSVPVDVNSLRAISNGYVTFGCFNNLAKISNEVVVLWARILQAVPHSRLYLKAKQFKYPSLRRRLVDSFACHGIDASRLILEGTVPGRSEHFEDYHRVDIALDPFPYPGITTSLEALWMGVPVLTMTGQSFLSRQGVGLLMNAGLPEWIASDADDYVARAIKQAGDIEGLARLRRGLREQVLASPLYDRPRFASRFEAALRGMWRNWCTPKTGNEAVQSRRKAKKVFLHVGCGPRPKSDTTRGFSSDEWDELRFDIDEAVKPDIVGTMLDMSAVADGSVDAVFSAHNIEHLYPHEVPLALAEFRRVLKPDGFVVITCPDLRSICQLVADDKLVEPAYDSPAGPIAPLDVLYGLRTSMSQGNLYMAHRCGFTERVLVASLQESGFFSIVSGSRGHPCYDLWALASKNDRSEDDVSVLADAHFPA